MSHILQIFARSPALVSSSRLAITQTNQVARIHNIKLAQLNDNLHATREAPSQLHGLKFQAGTVSKLIQRNQAAREIKSREVHGRTWRLMGMSNERKEPSQVVVGSVITAAALGTKDRATLARVELAAKRNLSAADMDSALDL